jgi:hypothetical protein
MCQPALFPIAANAPTRQFIRPHLANEETRMTPNYHRQVSEAGESLIVRIELQVSREDRNNPPRRSQQEPAKVNSALAGLLRARQRCIFV